MDTKFMIHRDSKTSDPRRLLLSFPDKINLKSSDKYVALSNLNIYYAYKNIKKSSRNNKFEISSVTWNEEIELPDDLYSVSSIRYYFKCIMKKHEAVSDNHPIKIYVNNIEGYY